MKYFRRAVFRNILRLLNSYPAKLTPPKNLQSLIGSLRPLDTDKTLTRIGPDGDGGYLAPDDFDGITACFSPGVSTVSGFEKDCADKGMKVFMADRSVDGPADFHSNFHFTKKFVGITTNDDFMTLNDWIIQSGCDDGTDLLLQMDIEGAEYEVLIGTPDNVLRRFRILVVEFHNLDLLFGKPFFKFASRAFEKLLQTHECVHIHPNNCKFPIRQGGLEIPPVAEFTFLRKDRIVRKSYAATFPHPQDCDNAPRAHYALPRCWYGA